MVKKCLLAAALLSLLLASACASATAGLAASNIPMDGKRYRVIGPVTDTRRWCAFDIGVIALPLRQPPINEVMQDLLKKNEADALINLRYWTDRTIFLFLTCHRFHLSAEAVKILD
ncbi:MAG: hypothetical protein HS115_20350 [Spirochaetales bacterium]|nr:hypothetical protein [Spirochaetales bacterium]